MNFASFRFCFGVSRVRGEETAEANRESGCFCEDLSQSPGNGELATRAG